jgi:hypothetical protein
MIKKVLLALAPLIDVGLAILSGPSALVLRLFRSYGAGRLPITRRVLQLIGVFPVLRHYYEPLFDANDLKKPLNAPRALPAIDFNVEGQLMLLKDLVYAEEFEQFVNDEQANASDSAFRIENRSFLSGDAEFLFQFVRHFKPSRIIEIGSGTSTKIASRALAINSASGGLRPRHICIEPFEQSWLEQLEDIELIRSRVEDCAIDWRNELLAGDLLFIDSSHIIRPQGDVLYEYLEIIPQLANGVLVHVHDIFSPRDYLDRWIRRDVRFWNEQYLLEATLGNTSRYEILAALNQLKHDHYDRLKRVCPYLERDREPGSFYFRVR